jgi:hypothetical protein
MNAELLSLLSTVSNNSVIGYCIQCALHSHAQEDIVHALKDMADENPEMLIPVVGERAFALLTQYEENHSIWQNDNRIDCN